MSHEKNSRHPVVLPYDDCLRYLNIEPSRFHVPTKCFAPSKIIPKQEEDGASSKNFVLPKRSHPLVSALEWQDLSVSTELKNHLIKGGGGKDQSDFVKFMDELDLIAEGKRAAKEAGGVDLDFDNQDDSEFAAGNYDGDTSSEHQEVANGWGYLKLAGKHPIYGRWSEKIFQNYLDPQIRLELIEERSLDHGQETTIIPSWQTAVIHDLFRMNGGAEPVVPTIQSNLSALSRTIRAKDKWWEKVKKPVVLNKWLEECEVGIAEFYIVIRELQWMADTKVFFPLKKEGFADVAYAPSSAFGTWQADGAVPEGQRKRLLAALTTLEDTSGSSPDFHPKSKEQVRNYVHPSLHCLSYGSGWSKVLCPDVVVDRLASRRGHATLPKDDDQLQIPRILQAIPTGLSPADDEASAMRKAQESFTQSFRSTSNKEKEDAETPLPAASRDTSFQSLYDAALGMHHPEARRVMGPHPVAKRLGRGVFICGELPSHYYFSPHLDNSTVTRVHDTGGKGRGLSINSDAADRVLSLGLEKTTTSTRFQWLPSHYDIDATTGKVEISSYIPGVDPVEHPGLYRLFAYVFEKAVPLLEKTLRDLDTPSEHIQAGAASTRSVGSHPPPSFKKNGENLKVDQVLYESTKTILSDSRVKTMSTGKISGKISATPKLEFSPPSFIPADISLRGMSLQVITKAARIYLDPAKQDTSYDGGNWHLEGMVNESILATVIYYAEVENVTESSLCFRKEVDCAWLDNVGGWDNEAKVEKRDWIPKHFPAERTVHAPLGKTATKEGRLLVLPNTMQHAVSPFELQDPSKPGWRTVIVYFVVHPKVKIPSTKYVPVQDTAWQLRAWIRILRQVFRNNHDVAEEVALYLLLGPSRDQMVAMRLELMDERSTGHVRPPLRKSAVRRLPRQQSRGDEKGVVSQKSADNFGRSKRGRETEVQAPGKDEDCSSIPSPLGYQNGFLTNETDEAWGFDGQKPYQGTIDLSQYEEYNLCEH